MSKIIKGKCWACVGYPESLPVDWLQQLQNTGLQIAISPLHDKDTNPDGTEKKHHYHIIFNYDGPTTYNNVKRLCDNLNMTIPIKLESLRGMYRYHLHLDNPEKYQYDDRERTLLNGFDVSSVNELTKTEIDKKLREIHQFINDNDIVEYCDLLDILQKNDLIELYNIAINKTIFLTSLLCSKRNKEKTNNDKRNKIISEIYNS